MTNVARTRIQGRPRDLVGPQGGLLSVDDAAHYLGISPGTLRNWISMRRIDHVKVGRLTRLAQPALDRYIAAHTIRAEVVS
jgi:excisionase family DNA binding protein